MKGYSQNIEEQTELNNKYRKVLYTGGHSQLVLMSLQPNQEIGLETHYDNDQFFRIESGSGKALIDDNEYQLRAGSAVLVPAGATHNIINASDTQPLKLYTIYSPAHHKDGVEFDDKASADASDEEFDGRTTE
jgi:mannose-6-phosphate isomerase-like protein (cupin superfamily)